MERMLARLFSLVLLFLAACKGDDLVGHGSCFLVHEEKLLVVEQTTGKTALPGGQHERNEAPRACAVRETLEETGLEVTATDLLGLVRNRVHVYRCAATSLEPKNRPDPREVRRVLWLPLQDFPKQAWRFPSEATYYATWYEQVQR